MPRPPISTAFMDESKHKGFILVASICPTKELVHIRPEMESLLLPGQTRLHFRREQSSRKKAILRAVSALTVQHVVFDFQDITNENDAREKCLQKFQEVQLARRVRELILELDEAHLSLDRRTLSKYRSEDFLYAHCAAKHDPGLWIPDAVAWCFAHGGKWRESLTSVEIIRQ